MYGVLSHSNMCIRQSWPLHSPISCTCIMPNYWTLVNGCFKFNIVMWILCNHPETIHVNMILWHCTNIQVNNEVLLSNHVIIHLFITQISFCLGLFLKPQASVVSFRRDNITSSRNAEPDIRQVAFQLDPPQMFHHACWHRSKCNANWHHYSLQCQVLWIKSNCKY